MLKYNIPAESDAVIKHEPFPNWPFLDLHRFRSGEVLMFGGALMGLADFQPMGGLSKPLM